MKMQRATFVMRAATAILFFFSISGNAQTILSASPLYATGGDYFSMTVVMSGTPSNPYNINLVSTNNTITPWSSYNTTGNTYSVSFLLRDYEKIGHYYLTYGSSTYPDPVRLNRPMNPEKFVHENVQALNIPLSTWNEDGINHMETDSQGNLYCTGSFTGTMNIGGQQLTASGFRDGYIMKMDTAGSVVWVRKTGSATDNNTGSYEGLNSLRIYGDSVICVTGYMRCDSTLKYNDSTPLQYPVRNNGTQDGILMKLDSAGNFQWAAFQGSMKSDATNDLVFDNNGSIFATGYAQSEDFSSSGVNDTSFTYVYNNGNTDSIALGAYANDAYGFFVAKYSSSGELVWAKRQSRDYFVSGSFPVRIKLGTDHNLVILTIGGGSLKWDGLACSGTSCCNLHYALIKMDTLGTKIWCLEDGNNVRDMEMGLDAANNIYLVTPTTWIGGDDETFLRKYNSSGTMLWSNFIQHNKYNSGEYSAVTDSQGNTYISHAYQHQWANNGNVILTEKYDANGNLVAQTFPEPYTVNAENKPTSIALSPNEDAVYLAGHFKGLQKFGSFNLQSSVRKAFLTKMTNCPVSYDSISVISCGPYITPSGNQVLTTGGFYADTLVNSAGCDSIILITLEVYTTPVISITASGPIRFCQGDSVILNATAGMATYQWFNKSYPIPGASAGSYTAKTSGTYYCLATISGQCPDTSNNIKVSVPCISVDPPSDKNIQPSNYPEISIRPNPSNGTLYITSNEGAVSIINHNGKTVLHEYVNSGTTYFDLTWLSDGLYTVLFQSSSHCSYHKVLITK